MLSIGVKRTETAGGTVPDYYLDLVLRLQLVTGVWMAGKISTYEVYSSIKLSRLKTASGKMIIYPPVKLRAQGIDDRNNLFPFVLFFCQHPILM